MKKNICFIVAIVLMLCFVLTCDSYAWIEMKALSEIESGGDIQAFNKKTKATGEYQIIPICLKDFNEQTKNSFKMKDLFEKKINSRVAKWYLFTRIPQLLKAKGIEDPTDAQILAKFGGYKSVKDAKSYLDKYNKAAKKIKPKKKTIKKAKNYKSKSGKKFTKKAGKSSRKNNSYTKKAKNSYTKKNNSYTKKSGNVLEFEGKIMISSNTGHQARVIIE